MTEGSSGAVESEIAKLPQKDRGVDIKLEIVSSLDQIVNQRDSISRALTELGSAPEVATRQKVDVLKIEAKSQDGLILDSVAQTLEGLEAQGIHSRLPAREIRVLNLQITDEIVDILAGSSVPLDKAIVLINKASTVGWRYRDWGMPKETIRGVEGYRGAEVIIGDEIDAPYHEDLPWLMSEFGSKLEAITNNPKNYNQDAAQRAATWAYFTFLTIHPFADGNGRTARALVKLVLNKLGQPELPVPGADANTQGGSAEASSILYRTRMETGFSVHTTIRRNVRTPEDITNYLHNFINGIPDNLSLSEEFIDKSLIGVKNILFNPTEKSRRRKGSKINMEQSIATILQVMKSTVRAINT